jgi:hypothetical protein
LASASSPVVRSQTPALEFSISVPGVTDCSTQGGPQMCDLGVGSTFVVDLSLDSLPGNVARYSGFDGRLGYNGITPAGDPSMTIWPDCAFAAVAPPFTPQEMLFGCAAGIPPNNVSTYTGIIATIPFMCTANGAVRIIHGADESTDLVDEFSAAYAEAGDDTLTINCVEGGPVPTMPTAGAGGATAPPVEQIETPGSPGAGSDDGDGGVNAGVVIGIVIAAIAAAGVLAFAGWRYAQRGEGTGGGAT